jgi:hypothetical protein
LEAAEIVTANDVDRLTEQRRRARIVLIAAPAFLSLLLLLPGLLLNPEYLYYRFGLRIEWIAITVLGLLLVSAAGTVMWYLQTGFKRETEANQAARFAVSEAERVRQEVLRSAAMEEERRKVLEVQLFEMRHELEISRARSEAAARADREPLVAELLSRARSEAADGLIKEIENRLEVTAKSRGVLRAIEAIFSASDLRLSNETEALSRRGNLNLVLGSATTALGLALLAFFVLYSTPPAKSLVEFGMHFILRVTLVIFIQVFAYFFLRLYKSSLQEIKYFQNELTTIQQKQIALLAATEAGDTNSLKEVIGAISKMDRNSLIGAAPQEQQEHDLSMIQTIGETVKNVASAFPAKS